jgi:hypothetical protein
MKITLFAVPFAAFALSFVSLEAHSQDGPTPPPAQVSSSSSTTQDAEPVKSVKLDDLPNAPSFLGAQETPPKEQESHAPPSGSLMGPLGPVPPLMTNKRLSFDDKLTIYTHQAFGPPALVFPALGAGFRMINPPNHYPHEWTDGAGAFGRLYGSALATQTSTRTAEFLAEAVLHDDPRYLPAAPGSNVGVRVFHAISYTFVDKTDSGHRTLAFSNFAGAAAGGFVGMSYLPNGFNDVTHAEQRTLTEFMGLGISNIFAEFAPQLAPIIHKLHLPQILPAWWVPEKPNHP